MTYEPPIPFPRTPIDFHFRPSEKGSPRLWLQAPGELADVTITDVVYEAMVDIMEHLTSEGPSTDAAKTQGGLLASAGLARDSGTSNRAIRALLLTRLVMKTRTKRYVRPDIHCPDCGEELGSDRGRCHSLRCTRPQCRVKCQACSTWYAIDPWGQIGSRGYDSFRWSDTAEGLESESPQGVQYDGASWICPACAHVWEPPQFWPPGTSTVIAYSNTQMAELEQQLEAADGEE